MIYNQMYVLPTDETLSYLSSVFADSSLDMKLSEFKVEVITTLDSLVAVPDRLYSADASSLKVWYDSYLQQSSLILSLTSNDLESRALELNQLGVLREWHNYYNPHMVIVPNMPALSKRYRRSILGMANAVMSNSAGFTLQFGSEYVVETALEAPPHYDYNVAMFEERLQRRNVTL